MIFADTGTVGKKQSQMGSGLTTATHGPHRSLHMLPTTFPHSTRVSWSSGSTLAPHSVGTKDAPDSHPATRRFQHPAEAHYAPTGTRPEADGYAARVVREPEQLQAPETTRKSFAWGWDMEIFGR